MMGMDKVLEDYMNDLELLPNITRFCRECGISISRFLEIRILLSNTIVDYQRAREEGKELSEIVIESQRDGLEILKNEIILPYCNKHPEDADRIMLFFDELFKDYLAKFGKSI
jgi:hypothetical protein